MFNEQIEKSQTCPSLHTTNERANLYIKLTKCPSLHTTNEHAPLHATNERLRVLEKLVFTYPAYKIKH